MKIVRITLLGCLAAVWIVACGQDTAEPPSPDPVDSWYNEDDIDNYHHSAAVLAVWKALGRNPFKATKAELATVTRLQEVWGGAGFIDQDEIDLLAACVNLVELDIEAMRLTDEKFAALAGLTKLESLKLHGNRITDLSPIARLTNLRTLDISANPIADLRLRPVIELTNLTALSAGGIGLTDLRPLAGLVDLQYLALWGNQIDDLSPLAGLVQLETLNLRNNKIVDIQPLLDNIGIGAGDKIELQRNKLSDVSRQQLTLLLKHGARVSSSEPPLLI